MSESERFANGNVPRDFDEKTIELIRSMGSILIEEPEDG